MSRNVLGVRSRSWCWSRLPVECVGQICAVRIERVFVIVNIYFNVDSESERVWSMLCEHDEVQRKSDNEKNKGNLTVRNFGDDYNGMLPHIRSDNSQICGVVSQHWNRGQQC